MPSSEVPDPDALRAPEQDLEALRKRLRHRPPRHRKGEAFLRGPIPWTWLERTFSLPGKATAVALVLWKEAGCEKSRTVRFSIAGAKKKNIHPDAAKRGLRQLVKHGFVSVTLRPGCVLEVTLNDVGGPEPPAE